MNLTLNLLSNLEIENPVIAAESQSVTITRDTGTFAAGTYTLVFSYSGETLATYSLSRTDSTLSGTATLSFASGLFEDARAKRVSVSASLYKDAVLVGTCGATLKDTGVTVEIDPRVPVKAFQSDATLAEPVDFFTANATGIWDAISGLVQVPDSFDPLTAEHGGTTAGNLANTVTIQELADVVDGLVIPDAFDAATDLHGGTTAGNLAGTSTVQDLANAFDAFVGGSAGTQYNKSFSFMDYGPCYTTALIGWDVEEGSNYNAGGYVSTSPTLQNGTSYIELAIPLGATGFDNGEMIFVGNSTGTPSEAKLDLYVHLCQGANKWTIYTNTAYTLAAANTPQVLSLSSLTGFSNFSGTSGRRIQIETEHYSKSSKRIYLIAGQLNFVG